MKTIKNLFMAVVLLLIGVRYAEGLIAHSDAERTGVFQHFMEIDYRKKIWDNKVPYIPALSVLKKFQKNKPKSTIVYGWDKSVVKDILYTAAPFTSQAATGNLTITLASKDKHNILVNQNLTLCFNVQESDYTNDVYVVSKSAGAANTIVVAPVDSTKKIGIGSGVEVPSSTMINRLGTFFEEYAGSVKPIAHNPRKVTNYMQLMKSPYEYSITAAKVNLYTEGTIRNMRDAEAQVDLMIQYEKAILFNQKKWKHDSEEADETQNSKMQGLIYSVANGDDYGNITPAKYGYDTFNDDVFDQWQSDLFDPELGDLYGKRLVLCNKAARAYFTKKVKDNPQYQLKENGSYGVRGINTVYTDSGELDLMVHPKISARFPDKDKPFMLAITPPMISIEELISPYLAANIQNNDVTGYKSEYRVQASIIANNVGTPYFGILYDATKPIC